MGPVGLLGFLLMMLTTMASVVSSQSYGYGYGSIAQPLAAPSYNYMYYTQQMAPYSGELCIRDSDCSNDRACIKGDCRDPCDWYKLCAQNAECRVNGHQAICTCPPGYDGDPLQICNKVLTTPPPICTRDSDCPYDKACIKEDCRDPCQWYTICGQNAQCRVTTHHAVCSCMDGFEGNPVQACSKVTTTTTPKPICTRDEDCPRDRACIKEDCRDPCNWYKPCGQFAECRITAHRATCMCQGSYEGDPLVGCTKVTPRPPICTRDNDCPYDKACIKDDCRDPCEWQKPCGQYADCKPVAHRATCNCRAGFEGNPMVACTLVTTPRPVCVRDNDCPYGKACIKEDCRNPCEWQNPCGPHAECKVVTHRATCNCLGGFEGNPLVGCTHVTTPRPICTQDGECPHDRACIKEDCRSPCDWYKPCGENAQCRVVTHRATCNCLNGYDGNPMTACARVTPRTTTTPRPICLKDQDCPLDRSCIKEDCRNPCDWYHPCGSNAECRAISHYAVCTCRSQFEGNPHVGCYSLHSTDH